MLRKFSSYLVQKAVYAKMTTIFFKGQYQHDQLSLCLAISWRSGNSQQEDRHSAISVNKDVVDWNVHK